MRKIKLLKEESPNLQKLMRDFCMAKQFVYNYDSETFAEKVRNFEENVQSIVIIDKQLYLSDTVRKVGTYNGQKLQLILFFDPATTQFSSEDMQMFTHELNHAWNYERGKRGNIIPLPTSKEMNKKYLLMMEVLNEAESQLLLSAKLKNEDSEYNPEFGEFSTYNILEESIFDTLSILCNQTGIEFLRSIEGMDVNGLISYISEKTGYSVEETKSYLENLGLLHNTVLSSFNSLVKTYNDPINKEIKRSATGEDIRTLIPVIRTILDNWLNSIEVKEYLPEYQEIYELSKRFIVKSKYDDNEKATMLLKFEAIQERINRKLLSGVERIANAVTTNSTPKNVIDTNPNLRTVEHEEYDRTNPNANFEFGRIDSPQLIDDTTFEFPWFYRQENELQKSLIGKSLFSRVKTSSISMVRNFMKQHLNQRQEKGDEDKTK